MEPERPFDPTLEAPVILDRGRHSISRRNIDPDALKVLYRLSNHGFTAYLVGGAVRDLLLGRRPADFDIGTNARPNQIKKLFRNAFLIGRRFRLAHIKFHGGKTIEVSTFRRKPDPEELEAECDDEAPAEERAEDLTEDTAGDPEHEDAFRRDLTINALIYDVATFSVIDYVGGLEDLELRRIRIIGDPDESYTEDSVRIWRVLRHAARLGFSIEERTAAAIPRHRERLAVCAGSRLFEELNKDIKTGNSRPFFEAARAHGVLPLVLGGFGAFYERDDAAFSRLTTLLAAHDAAVASGAPLPLDVAYALLLWPWAAPLLPALEGDKVTPLYDLFRATKPAALVPKILLYDAIQTLVIVEQMIQALETGKMRWSLKKRPHYPGASQLASLLLEGSFGDGEDPFAALYDRKFGSSHGPEPHPSASGDDRPRPRRRRRRKPKKPAPPSARPA